MTIVYLLLLVLAAVCFGIAAANRPTVRLNLVALGLLLWVAVPLLQMLLKLES